MKKKTWVLFVALVLVTACHKEKPKRGEGEIGPSKPREERGESRARPGAREAPREVAKDPRAARPDGTRVSQRHLPGSGHTPRKGKAKAFDIMNAAVIRVKKDLTAAYKKGKKATYVVTLSNPEAKLPTSPYQKVKRIKKGRYVVTILRPKLSALPKKTLPLSGISKASMGKYLRPSPTIQSNAPLLKKLAAKGAAGAKDALTAARRLEAFVFRYIKKKGYEIPAATALDVARARQGDCSEHAYLLAGLARAMGIPSRVVSGVLFAPRFMTKKNIFVYHMWTELWLGKGWVPFDGTRPKPGVGVTHMALATDPMDSMVPMGGAAIIMRTMGQMSIKVIKVAY